MVTNQLFRIIFIAADLVHLLIAIKSQQWRHTIWSYMHWILVVLHEFKLLADSFLNIYSDTRYDSYSWLIYWSKFKGHVSAGLILGGIDPAGSHVIQIHPYGSTANLPYTTMGSGSLAAMSVLEDSWQPGMNEEQVSHNLWIIIVSNMFSGKKMCPWCNCIWYSFWWIFRITSWFGCYYKR